MTNRRMKVTPATHSEPDVSVPSPVTDTLADTNSKYVSTGVPSNFVFYEDFDTLSIRPFTLEELKKISRAYLDQNLKHLVEAVGACIDRKIYDLTIKDFWSLLYWERINSYKRYPYVVSGTCTNIKHLKDVEEGKLAASTLNLSEVLSKSSLVLNEIDVEKSEEIVAFVEDFAERTGVYLYPPTVSDLLEVAENPELADSLTIQYAMHINKAAGKTLADRELYLENSSLKDDLDSLSDIDKFIELCEHGVDETFNIKCNGCGASSGIELSIDALSFFPNIQRK